jgi:hypothetical protein
MTVMPCSLQSIAQLASTKLSPNQRQRVRPPLRLPLGLRATPYRARGPPECCTYEFKQLPRPLLLITL